MNSYEYVKFNIYNKFLIEKLNLVYHEYKTTFIIDI